MKPLARTFPFRDVFKRFLEDYAKTPTYWYVPKARTLNDENLDVIVGILSVVYDEFLEAIWNVETQERMLRRLVELGILSPYTHEGSKMDRAALVRIWKKLLETLGLLWVQDGSEIVITDAGLDLLGAEEDKRRSVLEEQVIRYQYPNPTLASGYAESFEGLLPHVFLLQVLLECDNQLSAEEYELFVNLARSQNDIGRVVKYICCWRDIAATERDAIMDRLQGVLIAEGEIDADAAGGAESEATRHRRIHLNSSYQRAFFAFPSSITEQDGRLMCRSRAKAEQFLRDFVPGLKITKFRTLEDWFAYFGNPKRRPTWATYLIALIEDAASAKDVEAEVQTIISQQKAMLTSDEDKSIRKAQIEKGIETFYCSHPEMLEKGLSVVKGGRQFSTPGRIDLLCMSKQDEYVIVEIKADEAQDSVFGQILRYIGWVHRNINEGRDNVRGIILASEFSESARYSRIGLLKPDYKEFLQFKKHGLNVQDT